MQRKRQAISFAKRKDGTTYPITAKTGRRRSIIKASEKKLSVVPNRVVELRRHLRKIQRQIEEGKYERDDYPDLVAEEEHVQAELAKIAPKPEPKPLKRPECGWLDGRQASYYYFPNIDSDKKEFVCREHKRRAEDSGFVVYPISELSPEEWYPKLPTITENARCFKCGGFILNEKNVTEGEYFQVRGENKPLCMSCAEKAEKKGYAVMTVAVEVTPDKPKEKQIKCEQCHRRMATCECLDCGKQVCEECFDDYHGKYCPKRKSQKSQRSQSFGGDTGIDADFKSQKKPAEDEGPVTPTKSTKKKSRKDDAIPCPINKKKCSRANCQQVQKGHPLVRACPYK